MGINYKPDVRQHREAHGLWDSTLIRRGNVF